MSISIYRTDQQLPKEEIDRPNILDSAPRAHGTVLRWRLGGTVANEKSIQRRAQIVARNWTIEERASRLVDGTAQRTLLLELINHHHFQKE